MGEDEGTHIALRTPIPVLPTTLIPMLRPTAIPSTPGI